LIAVYPGRFDPCTNGHLDLISRAALLFDQLIVAVYELPEDRSAFSTDERLEFVRSSTGHLSNVTTKPFAGLLTTFAEQQGAAAIVRGLRAVTDFSVELDQSLMYKEMAPHLEQVFLMSDLRNIYLSASRIREVAALGYDVSGLVPPPVAAALAERFPSKD
jgi:pantetheine-phosphate adenylyltransferase